MGEEVREDGKYLTAGTLNKTLANAHTRHTQSHTQTYIHTQWHTHKKRGTHTPTHKRPWHVHTNAGTHAPQCSDNRTHYYSRGRGMEGERERKNERERV